MDIIPTPEHYIVFSNPEEQAAKLEELRKTVSWEHGRPMAVKATRQNHYVDGNGNAVYELWATFEPQQLNGSA